MRHFPRLMSPRGSDGVPLTPEQAEKLLRDQVARLRVDSRPQREARWQLMNFLIDRDRRPEAFEILTGLLASARDAEERASIVLATGQLLEQLRDYESARATYAKGVGLEPVDPRTWYLLHNNLGFCLNKLGRYAEAERWCRAAIEIQPERHNAHKNLGIACEGLGRFAEAIGSYIRAVQLGPHDPRALTHLEELMAAQPGLADEIPGLERQVKECRAVVAALGGLRGA